MKKRDKRERKKKDRGIVDFMMVTNHFFHSLNKWISEMNDPRNQSYITYKQTDLGYMAILKNICGQYTICLLYTSPSPRDISGSRMPSSA